MFLPFFSSNASENKFSFETLEEFYQLEEENDYLEFLR